MPIAYYSKEFSDSERKYSVYEKEALAAILCMEKWHEFLEVEPYKLITDNESLSYVLHTKRRIGRLARWVERLLNLPFTVEFKRITNWPMRYLVYMVKEVSRMRA